MKYAEMMKFANYNQIDTTKIDIAFTVDSLIEQIAEETGININDEEFENICKDVYEAYIDDSDDIYDLAMKELGNRGYTY